MIHRKSSFKLSSKILFEFHVKIVLTFRTPKYVSRSTNFQILNLMITSQNDFAKKNFDEQFFYGNWIKQKMKKTFEIKYHMTRRLPFKRLNDFGLKLNN